MRRSVVDMANESKTWTAQAVATTLTQNESKEGGWLQIVSIRATMQDRSKTTYQCRPSHPPSPKTFATKSLSRTVDAQDPQYLDSKHQTRARSQNAYLDAQLQCDRSGVPKTDSNSRRTLFPSEGVGRSADEVLKTLDEIRVRSDQ